MECNHGDVNKTVQRIKELLDKHKSKNCLLVCGKSFSHLGLDGIFDIPETKMIVFQEFAPNPLYEDICKGVKAYRENQCDFILAIGGGSALDVAKCIKLFSSLSSDSCYLEQEFYENHIPLLAIPTTAGTGSEATRYAIIYYKKEKYSVVHESILPTYTILDASLLETLPMYQKKCTLLDALCQAIESWWSMKATSESIQYARKSIELIMGNYEQYLAPEPCQEATDCIMIASNYAGKAINITATTSVHALSYKISSLYQVPHGHAVAICLPHIWKYMLAHMDQCQSPRRSEDVEGVFEDIGYALGCKSLDEVIPMIEWLLMSMDIAYPEGTQADMEALVQSVNPAKLTSNPVYVGDAIEELYRNILSIA